MIAIEKFLWEHKDLPPEEIAEKINSELHLQIDASNVIRRLDRLKETRAAMEKVWLVPFRFDCGLSVETGSV